jgi:hypothetical protein
MSLTICISYQHAVYYERSHNSTKTTLSPDLQEKFDDIKDVISNRNLK